MNVKFVVSKLPSPEHVGDWHDKPLKGVAKATEPYLTQKFSTKQDARTWVRCVRRANTFNEAQALFQQLSA